MHPMLNVAVKAARRAGTVINRASLNLERLQVDRKQHNDFVTEVVSEAVSQYRDDSFLLQFLTPRVVRDLKLFAFSALTPLIWKY